MNTRAKWAYLPYNSIQQKINEGILDAYDVVYTSDSHENVVVSPDLEIWSVKSRIYTFASIEEANRKLNVNTDTYNGQIVAILNNEKYSAYIVNQDLNGVYFATPLSADNIDYNNIVNIPIKNLIGTLDTTIIVDNLSSGIYKIKGQYKIFALEETVYLSADGDLFLVEVSDTVKYIKRFTKDTIQDFVVSEYGVDKKTYITDDYLLENGYTTTDYIDGKITALEQSLKEELKTYIDGLIEERVDKIFDEKLDEKLDERIQATTSEEVKDLFK